MNVYSNSQLTLSVQLNDFATFANFTEGQNAELLFKLRRILQGDSDHFLYLWGVPGCGRTHLLQACCHQASEVSKTAVYLDLGSLVTMSVDCFEGLEQLDLVCLDNLDVIAGINEWEVALFHLYNRVRDSGSRLVVSANRAPKLLGLTLADLISRLAWGVAYAVEELNDDEKISVLQMRAQERGFSLGEDVCQFLLNRCSRNMGNLFDILSQLDDASLSASRRITIPFVKQVLALSPTVE